MCERPDSYLTYIIIRLRRLEKTFSGTISISLLVKSLQKKNIYIYPYEILLNNRPRIKLPKPLVELLWLGLNNGFINSQCLLSSHPESGRLWEVPVYGENQENTLTVDVSHNHELMSRV